MRNQATSDSLNLQDELNKAFLKKARKVKRHRHQIHFVENAIKRLPNANRFQIKPNRLTPRSSAHAANVIAGCACCWRSCLQVENSFNCLRALLSFLYCHMAIVETGPVKINYSRVAFSSKRYLRFLTRRKNLQNLHGAPRCNNTNDGCFIDAAVGNLTDNNCSISWYPAVDAFFRIQLLQIWVPHLGAVFSFWKTWNLSQHGQNHKSINQLV